VRAQGWRRCLRATRLRRTGQPMLRFWCDTSAAVWDWRQLIAQTFLWNKVSGAGIDEACSAYRRACWGTVWSCRCSPIFFHDGILHWACINYLKASRTRAQYEHSAMVDCLTRTGCDNVSICTGDACPGDDTTGLTCESGLCVVGGGGGGGGARLYEQCGGEAFEGPTTCRAGLACVEVNPYYSQCLDDEAAEPDGQLLYEQCGGIGYMGETACAFGNQCVVVNEYYSQCRE
jgi:hypothetical protein